MHVNKLFLTLFLAFFTGPTFSAELCSLDTVVDAFKAFTRSSAKLGTSAADNNASVVKLVDLLNDGSVYSKKGLNKLLERRRGFVANGWSTRDVDFNILEILLTKYKGNAEIQRIAGEFYAEAKLASRHQNTKDGKEFAARFDELIESNPTAREAVANLSRAIVQAETEAQALNSARIVAARGTGSGVKSDDPIKDAFAYGDRLAQGKSLRVSGQIAPDERDLFEAGAVFSQLKLGGQKLNPKQLELAEAYDQTVAQLRKNDLSIPGVDDLSTPDREALATAFEVLGVRVSPNSLKIPASQTPNFTRDRLRFYLQNLTIKDGKLDADEITDLLGPLYQERAFLRFRDPNYREPNAAANPALNVMRNGRSVTGRHDDIVEFINSQDFTNGMNPGNWDLVASIPVGGSNSPIAKGNSVSIFWEKAAQSQHVKGNFRVRVDQGQNKIEVMFKEPGSNSFIPMLFQRNGDRWVPQTTIQVNGQRENVPFFCMKCHTSAGKVGVHAHPIPGLGYPTDHFNFNPFTGVRN